MVRGVARKKGNKKAKKGKKIAITKQIKMQQSNLRKLVNGLHGMLNNKCKKKSYKRGNRVLCNKKTKVFRKKSELSKLRKIKAAQKRLRRQKWEQKQVDKIFY